MNAIFMRRSVRQFKDINIEDEKIEKILRAGMQAPSAWGQKSWEFIVVTGKDNLAKLSTCHMYSGTLKGAAAAIVVLGNFDKMKEPTQWQQDLGACTQNILLEATQLGLGSVWYGVAPTEEYEKFVEDLYDLPPHIKGYAIVGLGYPLKEDANKFIDCFDPSAVRYVKEEV